MERKGAARECGAKQAHYRQVVASDHYPVQIVWSADDPALPLATYGEQARVAAGLEVIHSIPGKHFPQEDQAPAIAATRVAGRILAAAELLLTYPGTGPYGSGAGHPWARRRAYPTPAHLPPTGPMA